MSPASRALSIGPLNIPIWLLGVLGGVAVSVVLQRTLFRDRRDTWVITNDALLWGLLVGLLLWKLTPLATRFEEIRELPSRLLYYPGGTLGTVLALIGAVGTIVILVARGAGRFRIHLLVQLMLPLALGAVGWAVPSLLPTGEQASYRFGELRYLGGYEAEIDTEQPTVVTAWATWCGPCTAQMPEIDRFYSEHSRSVNLVSLNLTSTEPSLDEVRDYMERHELSFPVALDATGGTAARLGIASTPTTIVLDASGRERARQTGAVNRDWLVRRVLPLSR